MFERIQVMLMKEFLELWRDPWAMFRLVVPLLLQMLVFGYAATFTVHQVATAVLDLDNTQASRDLISRIAATGRFDIVDFATSQDAITRDINADRAVVAIVIHAEFSQNLANGQTAPLQVIVDGTNSNTALIALGYVNQIVALYQADQTTQASAALSSSPPLVQVSLQERPWFNEGLQDTWFFIPGVIGTITLLQVVSLTAFAIVREREVGTLEQIMVSPIHPAEFILGKTVPFFLIGLADVALVSAFGVLWFHVPFIGDPLVMLLGASLFLLAALGIGLLL